MLWSQTQGRGSGTFYKSPDKGLDQGCRFRGQAFAGGVFDEQANRLFGSFTLQDDWILQHHIKGASVETSLQKRRSNEGRLERARRLYLEGGLTWQAFTRIKDEAEGLLASIHVPELDDALEAGKVLQDFRTLWDSASVARRNRLLRAMLNSIYVDLSNREIVGLAPKRTFLVPLLAMARRHDVALEAEDGKVLLGMVETGESRTPRPEGAAGGCATGLSDALLSPLPAFAG